MARTERLNGRVVWSDLSFVQRQRTPDWAIQVDIQYHLVK